MKSIIKFVMLIVITLHSCHIKKDDPITQLIDDRESIEKTIRSSIEWAQTKDTNLLYSIITNDSNYLEVHLEDRVVRSISNFKKAEKIWFDPRFKAVKCEIWDLKISFSQDGSVAWYYCMLNDINEWNGKPANWMNTRWTGVLEKRNNKWVIVQMHFSFAQK